MKFLKNFASHGTSKRRIRVNVVDQIIVLEDGVNQKIQEELWHKYEPRRYNPSINVLIRRMTEFRILKKDDQYLELSHDILAKIVDDLPQEDNLIDVLRWTFDSQFHLYKKEGSTAGSSRYLSQDLIHKMKADISTINLAGARDHEEKKLFWNKSVAHHEKQRRLRNRAVLGTLLLLTAITTIAIFAMRSAQSSTKFAKEKTRDAERSQHREQKTSDVFEGVGEAYRMGRNNLTRAFGTLVTKKDSVSIWQARDESWKEEFPLLYNYENDLIKNYIFQPFYAQEINMGTRHILSTKSRRTLSLGDQQGGDYLIFALARDQMLMHPLWLSKQESHQAKEISRIAEGVSSYEPYYKEDSTLSLLYSTRDGLFRYENDTSGGTRSQISCTDCQSLREIEHLYGNLFVAVSSEETLRLINISEKANIEIPIPSNIRQVLAVKRLTASEICYVATRRGQSGYYLFRQDIHSTSSRPALLMRDIAALKAFYSEGPYIAIGDAKAIYILHIDNWTWPTKPQLITHHRSDITSIDIRPHSNGSMEILVGSMDKKSSIYHLRSIKGGYHDLLRSELIGHTDAIHNVSFLEDAEDHILTAGQDGIIKVWNIAEISEAQIYLEGASSVMKMQFDSLSNRLFAGFVFRRNPQGYLYSFAPSLKPASRQRHHQYRIRSDNPGHLTSFDFYMDSLVIGSPNHLISTQRGKIRLTPNTTVNDLVMQGDTVFAATRRGLVYFPSLDDRQRVRKMEDVNFNSVAVDPEGDWVLGTSDDNKVYLWSLGLDSIQAYEEHRDKVRDACFTPDGAHFVSGSWDNTTMLWKFDGFSSTSIDIFKGHTSDIEDIAISSNGDVASASSDNTVLLCEIRNSSLVQQPSLIRHDHSIRSVAFGRDSIIYSGDSHGVIKRWNYEMFRGIIDERRAK